MSPSVVGPSASSRRRKVDGKLRGGDLDPNLDCEHAQLHHARVLLHELGRLGDLEARVLGLHGRLLQLAGRVLVRRHLLRGRGTLAEIRTLILTLSSSLTLTRTLTTHQEHRV